MLENLREIGTGPHCLLCIDPYILLTYFKFSFIRISEIKEKRK